MTSVLDEKRRLVLPKELAEELGLGEGGVFTFQKGKDSIVVKKAKGKMRDLRDIMSWNPERTGKPEIIREKETKEIWY